MKNSRLIFALAPAWFLVAGTAQAASIGIKFLDSQDIAFDAGVSAGAPGYAQSNWNFVSTDWSGSAVNDALFSAGVKNSAGVVVSGAGNLLQNVNYEAPNSDPVHFDSANTWRSGAGNTTANHTLMNGYLDDGNDNQPYVNLSLASFAGTFESFSVVLYVNGDAPTQGTGRYWLETWTDPLVEGTVITDRIGVAALGANFSGTFIQAGGTNYSQTTTPVNVDASAGNYIVFNNITARNIRIRAAGNGDPEDFGRGPLNAVQLVDTTQVPEPSTSALMGGILFLSGLRRRRS